MTKSALVWMRRDLRLTDHGPLAIATSEFEKVHIVFIQDTHILSKLPKEDRRITFLEESLFELHSDLEKQGSGMWIRSGDPVVEIPKIAESLGVQSVLCGTDYEPYAKVRDQKVSEKLKEKGIAFRSIKDQVVFEKREVVNLSGEPYKVFTPYSKMWLKKLEADRGQMKAFIPDLKKIQKGDVFFSFKALGFALPSAVFPGGQKEAQRRLKLFSQSISLYHQQRDFPDIDGTSSLSPYFRFGLLSVREAVRFCYDHFSAGAKVWLNELIWRDFYHMILDQFPHVVGGAFKKDYDRLTWVNDPEGFQAWCEGRTGFPIVDAAMRQLNETGWMHNRLRMIAAMFLTKDLLIDWRRGEEYFALKLMDFDLAANNGGWQWSASTGCDAQPYFRVMNPVSQSERFDPEGKFIKRFVPELKSVPSKTIHWPHEDGLFSVKGDYPSPIVDHAERRVRAIEMFKALK